MVMLVSEARAQRTRALANVSSALLVNLIEAASNLIEQYCDTPFISAARTEVYDGTGLRWMMTRAIPITALTTVVVKDLSDTDVTVATSNLRFDSTTGRIRFNPTNSASVDSFVKGFQNITITYTAGYASDSVPDAIQEATVQVAMNLYIQTAPANSENQQERMGEFSFVLKPSVSSITQVVMDLLEPYRRLEF